MSWIEPVVRRAPWCGVACLPTYGLDGGSALVVVARLAFAIGAQGQPRLEIPRAPARSPRSRAGFPSTLITTADDAPAKPGTDVLVTATAHPGPQIADHVDVGFRFGPVARRLRVFGKRVHYRGPGGVTPGPANPVGPTALAYELAVGGVDASGEVDSVNPAGVGWGDCAHLIGAPAHVIEPLDVTPGEPQTPGFAPVPSDWHPRRRFAGTMDASYFRQRAPHPPADRDPLFWSCAPTGQRTAEPLLGSEPFEASHLNAGPPFAFQLPMVSLAFAATVRGREIEIGAPLDTVSVDVDCRTVELTWRVAFPAPRSRRDLSTIWVLETSPVPVDLVHELFARIEPGAA